MKTTTWIAIAAISAMVLTIIWTPDPDRPDAKFLATDAYFLVAGEQITLPFVAVEKISMPLGIANPVPRFRNDTRRFETNKYKTTFLGLASNSDLPMQVATLRVFYGVYQSYGEHTGSSPICGLLSREWARQICKNKRPGILAHIPSSFTLVDRKSMPTFRKWFFPEDITTDQVARLKLDIGRPEVICATRSHFCYGVVAITNELLAIWNVGRTQSEAATEKRRQQGAALIQLVLNGFGNTENFENILQD